MTPALSAGDVLDLYVNLTERKLSKNASLKKWLCIKISGCVSKQLKSLLFPSAEGGGRK
jgi:hypothetical protein